MALRCPKCNSKHIYRSRARSLKESLLKAFNKRVYRCHDCNFRGSLEVGNIRRGARSRINKRMGLRGWVLVISFGLIVAVLISYYIIRSQDQSDQVSIQPQGQEQDFAFLDTRNVAGIKCTVSHKDIKKEQNGQPI